MSREPQLVCQRGHDMRVTRRVRGDGHSHCGECARLRQRARRRPEALPRGGNVTQLRLPFEPLERRLLDAELKVHQLFNGSSVKRWRTEGIPLHTADEICVRRLGVHPAEVWGQSFYEEVA